MFLRRFTPLALLCLVAVAPAARAEDKKSDSPSLVIRVQSIDSLLDNFKYLAGLAGRERTLSIRPVSAARLETREREEFWAVVHRADRLDFSCWLAPVSSGSSCSGPLAEQAIEGDRRRRTD